MTTAPMKQAPSISTVMRATKGTASIRLMSAYLIDQYEPSLGYVDMSSVEAANIGINSATFTRNCKALQGQGEWRVERRGGAPNRFYPLFLEETSTL